jgi:hypothetical protein
MALHLEYENNIDSPCTCNKKKPHVWSYTKFFLSLLRTSWIVFMGWPLWIVTMGLFLCSECEKTCGTKMASHGPIQWTYIATMTSNVSPIFKSLTWKIDGNASRKEIYLFNFVIVVKSSTRLVLLSRTKLSTQMCQFISSACTLSIYKNHTRSLWFMSQTWNIFPKNGLKSASPYKNFSNLSFFSF